MRIFLLCFLLIASDVYAQTQETSFDAYIDSNYRAKEPGGVVLVSQNGKIVYERAFGMANMELAVPMKKEMVFSIASITKQFTAVAILQLIQAGKLNFADTVGKFLPSFSAGLRSVTIGQLLSHTAGVPNAKNVNNLLIAGRGWLNTTQIMESFKEQPLDFPPGSAWAYSNSGYQLLGYILEKVLDHPYPEWMEENILKAADMNHSLYGLDVAIVPNRASPYIYTRRGIENAVNANVQIAFAAGAIQSTAEDLLAWYNALLSGRFINAQLLKQAWSRTTLANGKETDYGFGWFVGELQGEKIVEHSGNMGGFMSHVLYIPQKDILVVALFNFRGKLPEILASEFGAIMLNKPLNIHPLSLDTVSLRQYTATFINQQNIRSTIGIENGRLYYQKTGGPKWNIYPYATDKVFFDNTSTIGELKRDNNGRIISFSMQTRTGMSKYTLPAE